MYLRVQDGHENVRLSLVVSETKVALQMIDNTTTRAVWRSPTRAGHTKQAMNIPTENVYVWTAIMQLIPSDHWIHVNSADNPADCASRGLFPSELIQHSGTPPIG